MVFNATFNNITAISVEETGEKHRPSASASPTNYYTITLSPIDFMSLLLEIKGDNLGQYRQSLHS